jgi:PPM family protein phosphatase
MSAFKTSSGLATMRPNQAIMAAGVTNPGLQREVNEDRFHVDVARGVFAVIDGVGGQAAGGKAADVALTMLRARLERETGPVSERIRESITIANNEIHRLASTRPAWNGMACVLTVALVEDGHAVVGHVGDSRLYKLRDDGIEKITRDHSPVGEREDAHELSEAEAMRHPRRNEVYRDVGSEPHEPSDPEFVDIERVTFEPDAALLLCSDGLTDLVPSGDIKRIVKQFAGDPQAVVRALVAAANEAGGKDNITAVYVEGERFAHRSSPTSARRGGFKGQHRVRQAAVVLVVALSVVFVPTDVAQPPSGAAVVANPAGAVADGVRATQSINAAIAGARPGSQVIVEPGEYREQLQLKDGVRVVSRIPRGATIRLPASASEEQPAVVANGLRSGELVGFRIVGDAATPLGIGLSVKNSAVSIVDVEVIGATKIAVDFSDRSGAGLLGSEIHDNPGVALAIGSGSSPRISHNTFVRNGLGEHSARALVIERGALPQFQRNVFQGVRVDAFMALDAGVRRAVARDNWFLPPHSANSALWGPRLPPHGANSAPWGPRPGVSHSVGSVTASRAGERGK